MESGWNSSREKFFVVLGLPTFLLVEFYALVDSGMLVYVLLHLVFPGCKLSLKCCYAGVVEGWNTLISKLADKRCDRSARFFRRFSNTFFRWRHYPAGCVYWNERRKGKVWVLASSCSTSHTTFVRLFGRSAQIERSKAR